MQQANPPKEVVFDTINWLDSEKIIFHWNGDSGDIHLTLRNEKTILNISGLCAFPRNAPNRFIQFYETKTDGKKGKLIGMLKELKSLPQNQQATVHECLLRSTNNPEIKRILTMREEHSVFTWTVETNRGVCDLIIVDIFKNIYRQIDGVVIITDIDENHYTIPDVEQLDQASLSILNLYS